MEGRVIEYVDHLHEHFEDPVVIRRGATSRHAGPGYSITIREARASRISYPDGDVWLAIVKQSVCILREPARRIRGSPR